MFSRSPVRSLVAVGAVVTLAGAAHAQIIDDFSSGSDARYTHFDPLAAFGAGGTWSFPPGAYRMQAPASPDPAGLGAQRIFSYADPLDPVGFESNVFLDIVDWNPAVRTTIGMYRTLSDVGVGTTDGYFFGIVVGGGGPSQIAIYRIEDEVVTLSVSETVPELTPDHDYRMTIAGMPGTAEMGPVLLFDLANLHTPLGTTRLVDPNPPVGGQLMGIGTFGPFDPGSGTFLDAPLDATFDNFIAVPAPGAAALGVLAFAFTSRRRRV